MIILANGNIRDQDAEAALRAIIDHGTASTSRIQREIKCGYGTAARIIDLFEDKGIIERFNNAKPRKVLAESVDQAMRMLKS